MAVIQYPSFTSAPKNPVSTHQDHVSTLDDFFAELKKDLREVSCSSDSSPPCLPNIVPLDLSSSLSEGSLYRPYRPKLLKHDEDYVMRPENAFILFRRKCCEDLQAVREEAPPDPLVKKQRQADLSKTISQKWKSLPVEERLYWEDLAAKKKEHEALYPNYVYRPLRTKRRHSSGEDDRFTSKEFVPEALADPLVKKQRQADLSTMISQKWRSLPAEARQCWEDPAAEKRKEHQALPPNCVYLPLRTKRRHSSGEEDRFTGKEFVPPDVSGLRKREAHHLTLLEYRPSFSSTPTLPSDVQLSSVLSFSPLSSHYPTSPPASPPPHSFVQESKSQLHLTNFPTSPLDDQQTFVPNAYRQSSLTSQSENPSPPFAQESQGHFQSTNPSRDTLHPYPVYSSVNESPPEHISLTIQPQLSSAIPNIPDVDSPGTFASLALTDTSPISNAGSPPSTEAAPDPPAIELRPFIPPTTYLPTHHHQGSPPTIPPPPPVHPTVQSLANDYTSVPHGTPSWVRTTPTQLSPSARMWRDWSNIIATVTLILTLISTIVAILSLQASKLH